MGASRNLLCAHSRNPRNSRLFSPCSSGHTPRQNIRKPAFLKSSKQIVAREFLLRERGAVQPTQESSSLARLPERFPKFVAQRTKHGNVEPIGQRRKRTRLRKALRFAGPA